MFFNLFDITESSRQADGITMSEILLIGRLDNGETAAVFVDHAQYYIYLAASPDWDASAYLPHELNKYLIKRNKTSACGRTLCPCRNCVVCKQVTCICPCTQCNLAVCGCVCRKCKQPTCTCFKPITINSELCAKKRRGDKQAVLSVEPVERFGFIGYEKKPRLFYKIRLARASYASMAKGYLSKLNTFLPDDQRGSYECTPNAVDSFMRLKDAKGFGWFTLNDVYTRNGDKRTRCTHEYYVDFANVNAVERVELAPVPVRFYLDCEMLAPGGKWTKNDPICMVSASCQTHKIVHVWGGHVALNKPGWRVVEYENEEAMLQGLIDMINSCNPDILLGYNIAKFDLPRILKRCETLGIKADFSRLINGEIRSLEIVNESKQKGAIGTTIIDIPGRSILDPLTELRTKKQLRSYRMKDVAKEFNLPILKGDVKYSAIWDMFHGSPEQRGSLVDYCADDAEVCEAIVEFFKMVPDLVAHCEAKMLPATQTLSRGQNFAYGRLLRSDMKDEYLTPDLIRNYEVEEITIAPKFKAIPELAALYAKGKYGGGKVFKPTPALYTMPVTTFDFTSMYPNLIRERNICNTTFLGRKIHAIAMGLLEHEINEGPTGWCFATRQVKEGLLSKIVTRLLDARNAAKDMRDKYPENSPEWAAYEARQLAFKVSANSIYGVQGAKTNAAGNMAVAETVTSYGREYIEKVDAYLRAKYAHWGTPIYGDTDSIMFCFSTLDCIEPGGKYEGFRIGVDKMTPEIKLEFVEAARRRSWIMAKAINEESKIFEKPMKMAFEKILFPYLLEGCKKYAGAKYEPKMGSTKVELLMQGLETKRRDSPLFAAKALKKLLDMILIEGAIKQELVQFTRDQVQMLLLSKHPMENMIMTKNLSKPLNMYKKKDGTMNLSLTHVRAAKMLLDAGHQVDPGDRIEMLYVASFGKKASDKIIPADLYKNEAIDFRFYARYLVGPFSRALCLVLDKKELKELWNFDTYRQLAPSVQAMGGPLMRYFAPVAQEENSEEEEEHVDATKYVIKPAKIKRARFMESRQ